MKLVCVCVRERERLRGQGEQMMDSDDMRTCGVFWEIFRAYLRQKHCET
jgi:hypothetical protein